MPFPYLILLLLASWTAVAQEGHASRRPPFRMMRYEEDWSKLRQPGTPAGPFDALKWISLGNGVHLTVGGETRQRMELFRNDEWGLESPGVDAFLLQRYMVHADLHLGERFRIFGQLKSGIERGRQLGPRPIDEDDLDVHQAFVQWQVFPASRLTLRVGRQEVALGSSRLVSIREGPNVRQSFDGARLLFGLGAWEASILALRPARTVGGVFDDAPDHRQSLWGLYATRKRSFLRGISFDLYYLGLDRKRARFDSGTGREHRHSFGTRWSGKREAWDLDWEAVLQTGSFAGRTIRAWTVGTNTGYTLNRVKFQPRLGVKADITSGDRNPNDRVLGTFNALYPKGNYFSQADLLGPYNLVDLHPAITWKLHPRFTLTQDVDIFWRYSTTDGLYNVPGIPLIPGRGSSARFVGTAAKIGGEWRWNEYLSFEAEYQRLFAGRFLKEQGRSNSIDFVAIWASFKF